MNKRLHAYCSGSVQGVGFRFAAERAASSLSLTGWVRNLRDGRVEIMCEGSDKALKDFLQRIKDVFKDYISDCEVEWTDATGEFEDFDIRF